MEIDVVRVFSIIVNDDRFCRVSTAIKLPSLSRHTKKKQTNDALLSYFSQ